MKTSIKIMILILVFSILFVTAYFNRYPQKGNIFEILKIDKDDFDIITITTYESASYTYYSTNITKDNHYEVFTELVNSLEKLEFIQKSIQENKVSDPDYLGSSYPIAGYSTKSMSIVFNEGKEEVSIPFIISNVDEYNLLIFYDNREYYDEYGDRKENGIRYRFEYDSNGIDVYEIIIDICKDVLIKKRY